MIKDERLKIAVNTGDKAFFYRGKVVKDENGWLTILEDKEGLLEINKQQIITLKKIGVEKDE